MILSQTQPLCMGLRFLQSTLLCPDVYWAIPPRAKKSKANTLVLCLKGQSYLSGERKSFTCIHIFQSNKDLQTVVKGRKRSAEIMKKEIINLSLDLHLTCCEESSNVVVFFLRLLYLEPLLLPSQLKYQHEQEGIIIINLS